MRDWREIHDRLVGIARQRAALDVEEARWLRAADEEKVYEQFGCASVVEYLEAVLGYTPKVAVERLRVAHALNDLPQIESALGAGRLTFSAVRELTRVAVAETEGAWLAAAEGKRVHQVERLVSGHRPGELPEDPRTPELETVRYELELDGAALAMFIDTRRWLQDVLGNRFLTDKEVIQALCQMARGEQAPEATPHQIVAHVCERCRAGEVVAAGRRFDVDAGTVERMGCDAQHVGHVDGERPDRAAQEPSPAVRRMVLLRDQHRCRVPWCRATRYCEVHHIDGRDGADCHHPDKLVTLCGHHHDELHHGRLTIQREGPRLTFTDLWHQEAA